MATAIVGSTNVSTLTSATSASAAEGSAETSASTTFGASSAGHCSVSGADAGTVAAVDMIG